MRAMLADVATMLGGSFVAALIVKATLTLTLALVMTRLARRSRAAARHVLLAAAFAVLLALPAVSFVIPSRSVEVPTPAAPMSQRPAAIVPMMPSAAPERLEIPDTLSVGPARVPVSMLLLGMWAAGAFLSVLPVLAGMWQIRSLRRSGSPSSRCGALARELGADAGVRRSIDVRVHESIPGPMTYGLFRPVIMLPLDADRWSHEELSRAMIHELEHVRRVDWVSQFIARFVCGLYWFHPLAWMAWRRLGLEAERACDDAVVRRAEATAYADQLVLLAERLSTTATPPLLAMAAYRDLSTRVRAVLDVAQRRGRAGAPCVTAAVLAAIVFVTAVAPLRAVPQGQSQHAATQDPALRFETASVRPNRSLLIDPEEQSIAPDPRGTLTVVNMPLRFLIEFAYQIQNFQLDGGPDWIASDRFDILAKAGRALPPAAAGSPSPMQLMLRRLLEDRFKLMVHKETKQLPIYELVLARRDGKPGPQLHPATDDCAARLEALRTGAPEAPSGPPGPGGCGVSIRLGLIRFGGSPLTAFANTLSRFAQRTVVDRTGLSGNWEFELTFSRDPSQLQLPPGMPPPPQAPNADANAPTLFTALEEQLGLKLQPARGPVEVLVIDHVEQPTEN